jgi:hypothetical protein
MRLKIVLMALLLAAMLVPAALQAADVTCTKCGQLSTDGVQFCGSCGTPLPAAVIVPKRPPEQPERHLDPAITQLLGQLSDEDLRRIVVVMLERLEARQESMALKPNSVAQMSREELEALLKKYCNNAPVQPRQTSAFGGFLMFLGGAVLFVLTLAVLSAL